MRLGLLEFPEEVFQNSGQRSGALGTLLQVGALLATGRLVVDKPLAFAGAGCGT